ncbi:hypothetical protein D3C80_911260 [compost metagenome]
MQGQAQLPLLAAQGESLRGPLLPAAGLPHLVLARRVAIPVHLPAADRGPLDPQRAGDDMTWRQAVEPLAMARAKRLGLIKQPAHRLMVAGQLLTEIHHHRHQGARLLPVTWAGRGGQGGALPVAGHRRGHQGGTVPIPGAGVARPPEHVDVIARFKVVQRCPGGAGQGGLNDHGGADDGHRRRQFSSQVAGMNQPGRGGQRRRGALPLQQCGQHQPRRAGQAGRQAGALQYGHVAHHQERVQLQGGGGLAGLAQFKPGVCSGHADLVAQGERLGFGDGGAVDAHHGAGEQLGGGDLDVGTEAGRPHLQIRHKGTVPVGDAPPGVDPAGGRHLLGQGLEGQHPARHVLGAGVGELQRHQ